LEVLPKVIPPNRQPWSHLVSIGVDIGLKHARTLPRPRYGQQERRLDEFAAERFSERPSLAEFKRAARARWQESTPPRQTIEDWWRRRQRKPWPSGRADL
jgi:hypothetical protein